jgi:hypothetical protein
MITRFECGLLDLGLLFLNSPSLPSILSYITMPGIFLYLLLVFEGPGRIARHIIVKHQLNHTSHHLSYVKSSPVPSCQWD